VKVPIIFLGIVGFSLPRRHVSNPELELTVREKDVLETNMQNDISVLPDKERN
jgi:hypothetical protein